MCYKCPRPHSREQRAHSLVGGRIEGRHERLVAGEGMKGQEGMKGMGEGHELCGAGWGGEKEGHER